MIKVKKSLFACLAIVYFLCMSAISVKADTDGTELNILEPSKLEIQLGREWNGVQFQLKTDVGIYPEEIAVGEDGVLRLEIGGSSTYILTCLNSKVEAPATDHADSIPVSGNTDEEMVSADNNVVVDNAAAKEEANESVEIGNTGTVAGIPIPHLLLFCGGLLLSAGTLIAIRVISNKKKELYEYEDDDEDE